GQLAQVNTAGPVLRNGQRRGGLPATLPQAFEAHLWVRLNLAPKRPELYEVPGTLAAIVAQAVNVDDELRCPVGADHYGEPCAGTHTGPLAVALNPGTPVFRLRIYPRVGEQPLRSAGFLILSPDKIRAQRAKFCRLTEGQRAKGRASPTPATPLSKSRRL